MNKFSLLTVFLVLTGCSDNTPAETVDWYKTHDAERVALIRKCKASPGQLEGTPACINAQQAQKEKDNARRGWITPDGYSGKKKD